MDTSTLETEVLTDEDLHRMADNADEAVSESAGMFGYQSIHLKERERIKARHESKVALALKEKGLPWFSEASVSKYKAKTESDGNFSRLHWIFSGVAGVAINFLLWCLAFQMLGSSAIGFPIAASITFSLIGGLRSLYLVFGDSNGDHYDKENADNWEITSASIFLAMFSLTLAITYIRWMNKATVSWQKVLLNECEHSGIEIPEKALAIVHSVVDALCAHAESKSSAELKPIVDFSVDHRFSQKVSRSWQIDRDPFLVVTDRGTGEDYYVAVWDEPGFQAEIQTA